MKSKSVLVSLDPLSLPRLEAILAGREELDGKTGGTAIQAALAKVNIDGSLTKEGTTYAFSAYRDDQGNVNIYNVHDYRVIKDVATEVAGIIESIEELNTAAD